MTTRHDIIVTGASRGIGRALALALASERRRLVLVARDREALASLGSEIPGAAIVPGDISTIAAARSLGERLVETTTPGATLVHNAGIWPAKRVLTEDHLETAFAVNHVGPLVMQQPLLEARRLKRILVVGAGAMIKGRFDAERTPTGADFSALRTYCSTKLAFAIAMRGVAEKHPEVDVLVLHPGVVRTDLGARPGILGLLLERVKRRWESPVECATRLASLFERERWSPPGEARWMVESREEAWPRLADDDATRAAVVAATQKVLGHPSRGGIDSTG